MAEFLGRFGMTSTRDTDADGRAVLYSRGTDGAPYQHIAETGEPRFVGVGFEIENPEDLEALVGDAGRLLDRGTSRAPVAGGAYGSRIRTATRSRPSRAGDAQGRANRSSVPPSTRVPPGNACASPCA